MPKVLESASSQGMSNLQGQLRLAILQRYKIFGFDACLRKYIACIVPEGRSTWTRVDSHSGKGNVQQNRDVARCCIDT